MALQLRNATEKCGRKNAGAPRKNDQRLNPNDLDPIFLSLNLSVRFPEKLEDRKIYRQKNRAWSQGLPKSAPKCWRG